MAQACWFAVIALIFDRQCSAVGVADLRVSQQPFWWHYPNLDVPSLLGVNAVLRDLGASATLGELCVCIPLLSV
jgi:hypothetical protein